MAAGPRVGVLAFDDALGFEVFGFVDLVTFAHHIADMATRPTRRRITATVIGPGRTARLAGGTSVHVEAADAALDRIDLLVVPGFDAATPDGIDALLAGRGDAIDVIRTHAGTGRPVMSVCLGAFLLAEAGVLDGRRATTAWPFAPHLAATHPEIAVDARELVIHDGPVTTSAAFSSVLDLGLDLVRRTLGAEIARRTAKVTLTSDTRTSQSPYVDERLVAPRQGRFSDQVKALIVESPDRPWTLDTLADAAHVSTRTLSRRFRDETGDTPITFLHRTRVSVARELLETTDLPLGIVMSTVGYRDPAAFRQRFRSLVGLSPAEYRSQFRRPA